MKRYIICLFAPVLILIFFAGCAKEVSERYEIVPAVITDAVYIPSMTTVSIVNGKPQTQVHPASGHVEIVCKGRNEILQGVSFYERFYEHVGDNVWASSRIRVYDNDRIRETVINIFEDKEQAERILKLEGANG